MRILGRIPTALAGVTALSGCANDPSFKALARRIPAATAALAPTPQPTATGIDVMAVVGDAMRIPNQIHSLQHTIVVCSLALGLIGAINAIVMIALYRKRRTRRPPGYGLVPVAVDESYGGIPAYGFAPQAGYAPPAYAPPTGALLYGLPSYRPASFEDEDFAFDPRTLEVEPARICACGAAIAARSRAARCRRCVREANVRAALERERG